MPRIAPGKDLSVTRGYLNKYRNAFGMIFCIFCKNHDQKPYSHHIFSPGCNPGLFTFEPFRLKINNQGLRSLPHCVIPCGGGLASKNPYSYWRRMLALLQCFQLTIPDHIVVKCE